MRKLLPFVLATIAIVGCASHDNQWKVRDARNWPVQTWDANELQIVYHRDRCLRAGPRQVPVIVGGTLQCCEQVSLNSWGPKAAKCGGRKVMTTVAMRSSAGRIYVTGYWKRTPSELRDVVAAPVTTVPSVELVPAPAPTPALSTHVQRTATIRR